MHASETQPFFSIVFSPPSGAAGMPGKLYPDISGYFSHYFIPYETRYIFSHINFNI